MLAATTNAVLYLASWKRCGSTKLFLQLNQPPARTNSTDLDGWRSSRWNSNRWNRKQVEKLQEEKESGETGSWRKYLK